jgi:hypothetical protein
LSSIIVETNRGAIVTSLEIEPIPVLIALFTRNINWYSEPKKTLLLTRVPPLPGKSLKLIKTVVKPSEVMVLLILDNAIEGETTPSATDSIEMEISGWSP